MSYLSGKIQQALYDSYTKAQADGTFINQDQTSNLKAGRKNFITNGVVPFVNQEGNKTSASFGSYIADIFRYINSGTTAVANTGVGTFGGSEYIFHDVTTADASLAAGDAVVIDSIIEGYDAEPLKLGTANAKTVTLSFKHRHTKTGIYCVGLRNAASNRSYVFEYSQSVSDAEETHTETIQLDTTGTWAIDNTEGLLVRFAIALGTNFQTTAGSWQAGDFVGTSNQVNGVDTIGNNLRIRDIQLEIGSVATEPEYIPYSDKLTQVHRYYWQPEAREFLGFARSATTVAVSGSTPVPMRTIPTVSLLTTSPYTESPFFQAVVTPSGTASLSDSHGFQESIGALISGYTGLTVGVVSIVRNSLAADARL